MRNIQHPNQQKKRSFSLRQTLKKSIGSSAFLVILLTGAVFMVSFALSNNYLGNFIENLRAAVGYGCGQYGTSSTYGNDCPDPLQQSDLPTLDTLVGGISCTPDPVDATNTTTCTGTLPGTHIPPTGTLNMQVEGESPVACTFAVNTFTCSNMYAASVFGSGVNIQASIDANPFVNTGKTIQVDTIDLLQADLPNLDSIVGGISCTPDPAEVSPQTTTCSGTLPAYYNAFTSTLNLRLDAEPATACNFVGSTFTCTNLNTGATTGLKDVQAAIDANPFVNTGKTIQVNLIELKTSDLPTLNALVGGISCTPDPVDALSNTSCSGTLPSNYTLPAFTLQLRVQNQTPANCNFVGNTFVCNPLPAGTVTGLNNIQAAIGPSAFVNTGKTLTVDPIVFSQTDITSLNTLVGGITCTPNPGVVLSTTTCSGTLPSYYTTPTSNLQLQVNGQTPQTCNFAGNTFTCTNMSTGSTPGNLAIQGAVGASAFQNTGKTHQIDPITLTSPLLPTLNTLVGGINCALDPVVVNQTVDCNGTLPTTHEEPNGVLSLNVIGQSSVACSFVGQTFSCNDLPVGSTPAIRNVQASIGGGSPVNTGKTVNVIPITLSHSDINSLNDIVGGITCTPELTFVNSTIDCSGTLPLQYVEPGQSFTMSLEGNTPVTCSFTSNTFSCPNISTGATFGVRNLQAAVGSNTQTNTGKVIIIQSSAGGDQFLTESDIINIGTFSINDPFSGITCGTLDTVTGGFDTTCNANIKPGFILPLEFQMGVGTEPGGQCVQENEVVTCTDVPVINKEGIAILNVQIAEGDVFNTNHIVTVEGTNPNAGVDSSTDTSGINSDDVQGTPITDAIEDLSRTGAGITVILLTIASLISVTFIYLPQLRKKLRIRLK